MKAILIDSINKEVKEVEIGKGIDEMYKFLQCECFTIATYLPKEDAIFVDDEGESVDCKISFAEVKEKVKFYSRYELALGIAMGAIKAF